MLTETGKRVKNASVKIAVASTKDKNRILNALANALRKNCDKIIKANEIDLQNGKNNGMSEALLDRLMLNKDRVFAMAQGIEDVISLPDPVGRVLWETERPNGMKIQRVSTPLGVIGIIYEARPNVTSDAAALSIKSGNAAILRGGKEAYNSNSAIMDIMRDAISEEGFDSDIIETNMENFDTEIFYMFYIQSRGRVTVFRSEHPIYNTLRASMDEAYEEYISKDVCYKLPIRANIYQSMTALLRYYCSTKNESERIIYHNVLRLRPVINYIAEHYSEKIYIDRLSEIIMVSADYFTKMFKDSIGKTPVDYINGIRINRSMQLLIESDKPISEIAESVGFTNANYFHKIFKQYMGVSPLAYRKGQVAAPVEDEE